MAFYFNLREIDYYFSAIELKKQIPELKKVDTEYIESCLRGSSLMIYEYKKTETPFLVRLTLPVAIIVIMLLFVFSPIKYILTGTWGYKYEKLANWIRSLGF